MRVFVYFNLRRKVWSIKALEGLQRGRVVAHASAVAILGCAFRVSEAGRQRVIREQRKNVHAGIVGDLDGFVGDLTDAGWFSVAREFERSCIAAIAPLEGDRAPAVTYNPYKAPTFVRKDTGAAIRRAACVTLCGRDVRALV